MQMKDKLGQMSRSLYCLEKNPQLNSYMVLSTLFPSLESQRTLIGLQGVQRILIAQ